MARRSRMPLNDPSSGQSLPSDAPASPALDAPSPSTNDLDPDLPARTPASQDPPQTDLGGDAGQPRNAAATEVVQGVHTEATQSSCSKFRGFKMAKGQVAEPTALIGKEFEMNWELGENENSTVDTSTRKLQGTFTFKPQDAILHDKFGIKETNTEASENASKTGVQTQPAVAVSLPGPSSKERQRDAHTQTNAANHMASTSVPSNDAVSGHQRQGKASKQQRKGKAPSNQSGFKDFVPPGASQSVIQRLLHAKPNSNLTPQSPMPQNPPAQPLMANAASVSAALPQWHFGAPNGVYQAPGVTAYQQPVASTSSDKATLGLEQGMQRLSTRTPLLWGISLNATAHGGLAPDVQDAAPSEANEYMRQNEGPRRAPALSRSETDSPVSDFPSGPATPPVMDAPTVDSMEGGLKSNDSAEARLAQIRRRLWPQAFQEDYPGIPENALGLRLDASLPFFPQPAYALDFRSPGQGQSGSATTMAETDNNAAIQELSNARASTKKRTRKETDSPKRAVKKAKGVVGHPHPLNAAPFAVSDVQAAAGPSSNPAQDLCNEAERLVTEKNAYCGADGEQHLKNLRRNCGL